MRKSICKFIAAVFLFSVYMMQSTPVCSQGVDPVETDTSKSNLDLDFSDFDYKDDSKTDSITEEKKADTNIDDQNKNLKLDFSDFDWKNKGDNTNQTSESITIGSQTWMRKNLDVSTFRNGDPIVEAKTDDEWRNAYKKKKPAWCYYSNDAANEDKYGKLYNYYAVTDTRGLAPDGYKIPATDDWDKLKSELGGDFGKMKSAGEWKEGPDGTNESSFSGLPAGYRPLPGDYQFLHQGYVAYWWSSVGFISGDANYGYRLAYNKSFQKDDFKMSPNSSSGLSVRCVKE